MPTLHVDLGPRSYPILIGAGLMTQRESFQSLAGRDVLLVSTPTVAPLYLSALRAALPAGRCIEALLPDGEAHKTLATAGRLWEVLIANRCARDVVVLALGGGVVGDVAGFAAACYQRGVDFVQVPTTLLAQVDSAVGGKTGVNHGGGKNLVGAFHQPRLVVSDTRSLETLPARELRAGLAEVIKYGLICDADFFAWLEAHVGRLLAREPDALAYAIRRSCEIKAAVVGRDEREAGERALLNLGHTFGHAIEAAGDFRSYLHGEAVGAGLAMAASLSAECGLLEPTAAERVRRLVQLAGLPVQVPDLSAARLREAMRIDKKVRAGQLQLVLLRRIGTAFLTADYPAEALERTLAAHAAPA
ncbi:MAG: 3-dehydroquinate synthase [Gammaproteobacteria bacterium]|nr:3-dehydroquinate synthase [Gammaproteobacteria bacterium]